MNMREAAVRGRRRRSLEAWIATLVIGGAALAAAPAAQAEETVEQRIEKSILLVGTTYSGYVYVPYDTGSEWEFVESVSLCTGWFASAEGHIVTAGHCVDPQEGRVALLDTLLADLGQPELFEEAYANWTVEGEAEGSEVERNVQVIQPSEVDGAVIVDNPVTAQVVAFQSFDDGDVALLRVAGISDTPALNIAESNPAVGQELTAIGFPGSVSSVVDGARIRASFKSGTASSQQVSPAGVSGTEVNADISSGMSGGPTVDPAGNVYGVNSYLIVGEEQNFNFITDTGNLKSFLTSNNVAFTIGEPVDGADDDASGAGSDDKAATSTGGAMGLVWPIVLGLIGLAVVAGVVIVIVMLRRRQSQPAVASPAPAVGPSSPGASTQATAPAPSAPAVPGPASTAPPPLAAPVAAPVGAAAPAPQAPPPAVPAAPVAAAPAPQAPPPVARATATAPLAAAPASTVQTGFVQPAGTLAAAEAPPADAQQASAPQPQGMVACGTCGTPNAAGAHFCSNCGSPLRS